ncbi:MAG: type II secretion system minor pseudopilin GspK, partial [Pseudomonadota bacterium]
MSTFDQVRQQTGVALISVLLIVAILMAVASRLLASHNLVINQHQNTFEQNQALHYALGAETLASQALAEDQKVSDTDHLGEVWAQQIMPFELDEGGVLEAQLSDMQSCFNLNNLANEDFTEHLSSAKRLLQNLGLPEEFADAWKDWVDSNQEVTDFGAEDSEYLLAQPPHRTPNGPAGHISELALLQNLTPEQYAELLPHVCVLPARSTKINVNTASSHTLAAWIPNADLGRLESLVLAERNYEDVADFLNDIGANSPDVIEVASEHLSVQSEYFQLHAQAQVG